MHAPLNILKKLDVVFHAALWFVTGANVRRRTHHCNLYEITKWTLIVLKEEKPYINFYFKSFAG